MSKVGLFELHQPGAFSYGPYLVGDRICETNRSLKVRERLGIDFCQDRISIHNVESEGSKGIIKAIGGTRGLPSGLKTQGNRGIVVAGFGLRRIPVICSRNLSTAASSSSTVPTNAVARLRKIAELCKENPQFIVNDRLFRLLYDREIYMLAYEKIKSKPGNMTPGIVPTTLDGMSIEVVDEIIASLKNGSFRFQPGRRVYIPKANGKKRPLTIAPPRDKLVQEGIRMILEAIYEHSFEECSHGFRPNRSCHSALQFLNQKFRVSS